MMISPCVAFCLDELPGWSRVDPTEGDVRVRIDAAMNVCRHGPHIGAGTTAANTR